jgi:hypothetical protein
MTHLGQPICVGDRKARLARAPLEVQKELTAGGAFQGVPAQRLPIRREVLWTIVVRRPLEVRQMRLGVGLSETPLRDPQDPGEMPSTVSDLH